MKRNLIQLEKLSQSYEDIRNKLHRNFVNSSALDEVSEMLSNDGWTKIFLTGNFRTNKISLQVEISPKKTFQNRISQVNDSVNENEKLEFLKEFLSQQIVSLTHLLNLTEKGFFLEFIVEENIWFASKILDERPSEELSKLLSLPTKKE